MKTNLYLWWYSIFLRKKIVSKSQKKSEHAFLISNIFFPKIVPFVRQCWKKKFVELDRPRVSINLRIRILSPIWDKSVTTQNMYLFTRNFSKDLKCYNFQWVQRRHNCSPAASFANCVMTLYLLRVHLLKVSFYTNNSNMPNSELWHSYRKSATWWTTKTKGTHSV